MTNKLVRLEEQKSDEYTSVLAHETVKLLHVKGLPSDALLGMFLGKVIALAVAQALAIKPPGDAPKEERYAVSRENFMNVKGIVQDAAAAGMGAALSQFSGKQVDYYCQIKPVPAAKNTPC